MRKDGSNLVSGTISRELCERSILEILSGNFVSNFEILLWLKSSTIPEIFPRIKVFATVCIFPTFMAAFDVGYSCQAPGATVYVDHVHTIRPGDPAKSDKRLFVSDPS